MNIEKANEIMGIFNKCFDDIKNKKDEFEKKRMHDKEASLIYEGLRYSYIQLCEMQSELEESILTNEVLKK